MANNQIDRHKFRPKTQVGGHSGVRDRQVETLDFEHDPVEDRFFSTPPEPAQPEDVQPLEWQRNTTLSTTNRRAMRATVWILATSVLGLGSFLIYAKWIMPTPVELSASLGPARLPEPLEAAESQPSDPALHGAEVTSAGADKSVPAGEPLLSSSAAPPVSTPQSMSPPASDAQLPAETASAQVHAVTPTTAADVPTAPPGAAGPEAAEPAPHIAGGTQAGKRTKKRRGGISGLIRRAHSQLRRGDYRAARRSAELAVLRAPQRGDAWIVLGAARDAAQDSAGAQRAYNRCAREAVGRYVSTCKRLARK